jgi:uncharacterized protein (DUF1330 family)
MTVYVVAQLKFKDRSRYNAYLARFAETFQGSGGRLLAADEAVTPMEGPTPDKVVIMSFDDEAQARAFLDSPAYQAISEDRRAGADTTGFIVHGLAGLTPRG